MVGVVAPPPSYGSIESGGRLQHQGDHLTLVVNATAHATGDAMPPAATCTNILSVLWFARAGGGPGHSSYYCCSCSSLTVGTHYTLFTVVQPTTVYTVVGAWFSGTKHTGSSHSSKNCVVCPHYTRSRSSSKHCVAAGVVGPFDAASSDVASP